jgi:hypothetical protein
MAQTEEAPKKISFVDTLVKTGPMGGPMRPSKILGISQEDADKKVTPKPGILISIQQELPETARRLGDRTPAPIDNSQ